MQKITPFLWFNDNAEEAIQFYTSVFKDSEILKIVRYGNEGPGPKGSVMTATMKLYGQDFVLLNGGPQFKFNESVSFVVNCDNQEEVDYYWEKLSEGGEKSRCGWLKDKYGLSWQVTPTMLINLIENKDKEKSDRAMKAMMQMDKIIIKDLEEAVTI